MDRVILVLGGLAVGFVAGLLVGPALRYDDAAVQVVGAATVPPEDAPQGSAKGAGARTAPPAADTAALRRQLEAERARADALAVEIAALRAARPDDAADDLRDAGDGEAAADATAAGPDARRPGGWLDRDALLAAGFDPSEIDALRARFEEIELERLYVRDQATREGWLRGPRFRREMARLQSAYDALRDEYGDDAYDWILYASGRTNRVVATLVMRDSAAARAGIEAGDVIVAYGGAKVLDVRELQQATTTGEPGGTVAVDVLRDGEELRFYVPVGPLGVQLKPEREEPAHGR